MSQKPIAGMPVTNGQVAESEFAYEAPSTDPGFDLRSAEKNFIDQLLRGEEPERAPDAPDGEWEQELSAEEPEIPAFDEQVETDDPLSAPPPEPDPLDDAEPDEDPKLARGIQRVVQRELAAKAREEAAEAREKAAEAKIAELRSLQGLKPVKDLQEMAEYDVVGMFKAMGKDPDTMIKLALAQQLGDSAPQALKDFARGAGEKREIATIRAELAAERQARAAQEYFNTISAGAREYVTKVGDSKALPTLAKAVKVDSQYVHDEIMEEIVKEARVRAASDPDGEPLTYEEAAKRVESKLSRITKLVSVQNGMNSANKNAAKPKIAPPSTKPASKPLAPWQRRSSNLEEDGIQEALREYERMEAERKAARR